MRWLLLIFILISLSYTNDNEWRLDSFISPTDTLNILLVQYKDELGLSTHTIYCNVVWENKKNGDYRCTAPWIDKYILIKKSNILDLNIFIIPKSETDL